MFNSILNTVMGKLSKSDVDANIRKARREKLDRVREATAKRNAVRAYIGNLHAVSMKRVVLMDHISKYVGKNFTGRYVIKNSWGLNTKVNF